MTAPVPWAAARELAPAEGSGRVLIDAGLLSPFQVGGELWWAPHRLVAETVRGLWDGDRAAVHRRLGGWFLGALEKAGTVLLAQRAVEHLCAAGDADAAWPPAQSLVLWLRGAGRYREALSWVDRVLAAGLTGSRRGMALFYEVQLQRMAGSLPVSSAASSAPTIPTPGP